MSRRDGSPGDLTLWDTSSTRRRLEAQIEETGALSGADAKVQTKTGELLDCLVSAATITVDDDPCVLWVIQDITERRHSELELVTAIEAVMKDASWFSQSIVEKLANLRSPGTTTSTKEVAELTKREKEVLGLVCQGSDDQEISAGLSMSRNTVRNHVARIYAKIGVNRRGAAIVWRANAASHRRNLSGANNGAPRRTPSRQFAGRGATAACSV